MEDAQMMPESDATGNWLPLSDDEESDVGIEEEMVEEVMKRLEEEMNGHDSLLPYSASGFVTINGNEESCGPSFSDSASTVMASIDMGGASIFDLVGPTDLYEQSTEEMAWGVEELWHLPVGEGSVSADVEESDEEWMARVLSGPAFEFEL